MRPIGRKQILEIVLGFLGFFAVVVFVVAIVDIVRGDPNAWASLVLLVLVGSLAAAFRAWKKVQ